MLGAIAGDVIGSVHEGAGTKTKNFPLFTPDSTFTDDTVLTVAVADCLLRSRDYVDAFHDYFHAYPNAGYGGTFILWANSRRREPYSSWGNGSAMRVSPVAYFGATLEEVLEEAKRSGASDYVSLRTSWAAARSDVGALLRRRRKSVASGNGL